MQHCFEYMNKINIQKMYRSQKRIQNVSCVFQRKKNSISSYLLTFKSRSQILKHSSQGMVVKSLTKES